MLKEALELVQETARKAAAPQQILASVGDGRTAYIVMDGVLQEIAVKPAPRMHTLGTLGDVIAMAKRYGAEECEDGKLVLWHDSKAIVLIFDDADRRDRASMSLQFSRPFLALRILDAKRPPLEQREFIRLLRFELGVDQATIGPFRRLDWTGRSEATGVVDRGTDRMGRSISAECSGIASLPEDLLLTVPVYANPTVDLTCSIKCLIEIDAVAQRLLLIPAIGELEHAEFVIQRQIEDMLREELSDLAIYYGDPNTP